MALSDIVSGVGGFLSGFAWKIGTAAGVVGCVVLTGFLIAEKADNHRLTAQVATLDRRINDPNVGYVAALAQCHTNTAQVQTALETQNAELAAKSAADQAALGAAQDALNKARSQILNLQGAAAAMLAYVPQGASACERTQDVINHYLEDRQ